MSPRTHAQSEIPWAEEGSSIAVDFLKLFFDKVFVIV